MNDMLTSNELMKLLNLGRSTLTKWIKKGIVVQHKVDGQVRYKRLDIYRSLALNRSPKITQQQRIDLSDPLLTPKEAAEFLNIGKSTLASIRLKGQIPYYKLGNKVFFLRSELQAIEYKPVKRNKPSSRSKPRNRFSLARLSK